MFGEAGKVEKGVILLCEKEVTDLLCCCEPINCKCAWSLLLQNFCNSRLKGQHSELISKTLCSGWCFSFLGTVKPLFLTCFYPKRQFDVGKNGRGILSVLSPVLSQYFFQKSTLVSHTKSRVVKKEGNKGWSFHFFEIYGSESCHASDPLACPIHV